MSSQVVVGTQWGDEGKGKIVDAAGFPHFPSKRTRPGCCIGNVRNDIPIFLQSGIPLPS